MKIPSMVNSSSFGSEESTNDNIGCIQANSLPIETQSSSPITASSAIQSKNDFMQTADGSLPFKPHAVEPTPSKTDFESNITIKYDSILFSDTLNTMKNDEEKKSFFCSVPLEKVQTILSSYTLLKCERAMEMKVKNPRKVLCLYCDRTFVNVNLRQKHIERCHSSKQFRRVSLRKQQNFLTSTPCIYCDKFSSAEHTLKELFEHLIVSHSNKYFGCLSCEDRFLNSSYLIDHNTFNHNNITTAISEASRICKNDTVALNVEYSEKKKAEEEIPLKVTRSKQKMRNENILLSVNSRKFQRKLETNGDELKKTSNIKNLRNKKLSVKSSRMILKRSKRLQAKFNETQKKKRTREICKKDKTNKQEQFFSTKLNEKSSKSISNSINPYPEFDNYFQVKKITDHSIDNLKISSLTFDDVFDKAFFNRIKCNIQENLLHHIDGKLFKNEESENRISNFEKISNVPQEVQNVNSENFGCELSLNAVAPTTLLLSSQFGEDPESQIEYGSKPSKKKTQTKKDEVHYKYFTRRKYQASILEHKENRDLSKLDMWTQYVIKNRQQKVLDDKKSPKEILDYFSGEEYKNIMRREELNRILDRRGPFEDLREEVSKKAALDKINSQMENDVNEDSFTEVKELLNDILHKVFEITKETQFNSVQNYSKNTSNYESDSVSEIPSYLCLRRTSSLPSEGEIDKSDKIALICSSQETENFELPSNTVRGKNEKVELTGEWARSRIYVCAACGLKLQNIKQFLEHKSASHQYVWVQHYEFVGNQSELYRHLSIPVLGKVGVLENLVQCKVWKRSDARLCTKCGKQCNSLGELHRHILECGGDWTWMLARKKCKYRPFGAKSRRKRRGLVKRIYTQKSEPSEKKIYKKSFDIPRQKPSDADTIQRMLANLPPKRATRKIMCLKDGFSTSRKKQIKAKQSNLKYGKLIHGKGKEQNKNTNSEYKRVNKNKNNNYRRSLRSLNKVLTSRILDTNSSLIVRRKYKKKINNQQTKNSEPDIGNELKDVDIKTTEESSKMPSKKPIETRSKYNQNTEFVSKRCSPRIEKRVDCKNLVDKMSIKRFFPIKKKKNFIQIDDTMTDMKNINAKLETAETSNETCKLEEALEDKSVLNDSTKNFGLRKRRNMEPITSGKSKVKKKVKSVTSECSGKKYKPRNHVKKIVDQFEGLPLIANEHGEWTQSKTDHFLEMSEIDSLDPPKLELMVLPINISEENQNCDLFKDDTEKKIEDEEIIQEKEMLSDKQLIINGNINISANIMNSVIPEAPKKRIRKPTRGLNDCIAMLTSKLNKNLDETSLNNSIFDVMPSSSVQQNAESEKSGYILKVPLFNEHFQLQSKTDEPKHDLNTIKESEVGKRNTMNESIKSLSEISVLETYKVDEDTVLYEAAPENKVSELHDKTLESKKSVQKEKGRNRKMKTKLQISEIVKNLPSSNNKNFRNSPRKKSTYKQNQEIIIIKSTDHLQELNVNNFPDPNCANEIVEELNYLKTNLISEEKVLSMEKLTELIDKEQPSDNLPSENGVVTSDELDLKIKEITDSDDEIPLSALLKDECIRVESNENNSRNSENAEMNEKIDNVENKNKVPPDENNTVENDTAQKTSVDNGTLGDEVKQETTQEEENTKNDEMDDLSSNVNFDKCLSKPEEIENSITNNANFSSTVQENIIKSNSNEIEGDAFSKNLDNEGEQWDQTIIPSKKEIDNDNSLNLSIKRTNVADMETIETKEIFQNDEIINKENSCFINGSKLVRKETKLVGEDSIKIKQKSKRKNMMNDQKANENKGASSSHSYEVKENTNDINFDEKIPDRKKIRNAKAKALESILDDALSELTDSERNRDSFDITQINNVSNTTSQKEPRRKKVKTEEDKSTINMKLPEMVETVVSQIEHCTDSKLQQTKTENLEENFANKHQDPCKEGSDNLKNDNDNVRELRRSRRNNKKIASYNEIDLVDPLFDDLNGVKNSSKIIKDLFKNKTLSGDECFGFKRGSRKTYSLKKVTKEEPKDIKLNGDELFDLLKTTPNENIVLSKPTNSFFNNFDEISDDFSDNFDVLENILEKSIAVIEENLAERTVPALVLDMAPNEVTTCEQKLNKTVLNSESNKDNYSNRSKTRKKCRIFRNHKQNKLLNKDSEYKMNEFEAVFSTRQQNSISSNSRDSISNSDSSKSDVRNGSILSSKEIDKNKINYCEICNKTFSRVESLTKHKRTLTHISKLSELEAKEAESKRDKSNEQDQDSHIVGTTDVTSESKKDLNLLDILETIEKNDRKQLSSPFSVNVDNSGLKLADIINDVLNKPVLKRDNDKHIFADFMQNRNETESDVGRYKSLAERKSFETENCSVPIKNDSLIKPVDYFEPEISNTAGTILEKQITLLENIIENRSGLSYVDELSISSTHSAHETEENVPVRNELNNEKPENSVHSYTNQCRLETNTIKQNMDESFLKPSQYEEISEDSNLRNYDEQKSRKVLNRDEELFLECCSLLKSGSEVSSYSKKSNNLPKDLSNLDLKPCDEPDWLENNYLSHKENHQLIECYSDSSRIATPLGDSFTQDESNSDTISSQWNINNSSNTSKKNNSLYSDMNNKNFSFEEAFSNENNNDEGVFYKNKPNLQKEIVNDLDGVISEVFKTHLSPIDQKSKRYVTHVEEATQVSFDNRRKTEEFSDASTTDSKKMLTKGAMKIFEGLKVSIPTEDLNMDKLLINSPPLKKPALNNSDVDSKLETKRERSSKSQSEKKSTLKAKKKTITKSTKTKKQNLGVTSKIHDVYDFEETQDNSDVFPRPDFRSFRNSYEKSRKSDKLLDSDNDSQDGISFDAFSSSASSVSELLPKKTKTPQNITKKKCMIMGRIFKNAVKSRTIDEDIRNIPVIDNTKLVEDFVLSCPEPTTNDEEKRPDMTEEDLNLAFDKLVNSKSTMPKHSVDSKSKTEKNYLNKRKKIRNKKRSYGHSDSTDDEFKLQKSPKRRTKRKNDKDENGCINLEQELKECIGVASRKSQRKCTSGKQNILMEYWSSDESTFEAIFDNQISEQITLAENTTIIKNSEFHQNDENKTKFDKEIINSDEKQSHKKSKMSPSIYSSNRRKRAAVNPLYHWSSSSEDESRDLIEIKPLRDEIEDDEDRPVQHGWIVGDSPKKLVTMLAQAKGKKCEFDSVKEHGKKRTNTFS